MTDSSMYSSLFALVESHLSKTSLQQNDGNSNTTSINIPINNLRDGSISESLMILQTRPRLPIPSLSPKESSIQPILAQQVANMLIAKEKRQQEEKQKLEEQMMRLKLEEDEKNSLIDLTKAIQIPYNPKPRANQQETLSSSSSVESLFKLNFTDCDGEPERTKTPEPELPCITDMSYILKEKIKMGKGSAFGKVLSSRLRPVPVFYFREKIPTNIKRFDFSTPSPCDIVKANRKYRPTMSTTFTMDITKFV
ncbi:uncharacterized protein [Maniola hyperantus]|uniref:uncharacterized protein n=1 Tax=Aphantopus hyperantus TaxID=2795564 RepID=UPI001569C38A|nr:uncharacterized protein LOC117995879 [Maniola hyperantus]